jgi:hypothetical protein
VDKGTGKTSSEGDAGRFNGVSCAISGESGIDSSNSVDGSIDASDGTEGIIISEEGAICACGCKMGEIGMGNGERGNNVGVTGEGGTGVDGREDTKGAGDVDVEFTGSCRTGRDNDKGGGGINNCLGEEIGRGTGIKGVETLISESCGTGRGNGINADRGLSTGCSTGNLSTGINSLTGPRGGII